MEMTITQKWLQSIKFRASRIRKRGALQRTLRGPQEPRQQGDDSRMMDLLWQPTKGADSGVTLLEFWLLYLLGRRSCTGEPLSQFPYLQIEGTNYINLVKWTNGYTAPRPVSGHRESPIKVNDQLLLALLGGPALAISCHLPWASSVVLPGWVSPPSLPLSTQSEPYLTLPCKGSGKEEGQGTLTPKYPGFFPALWKPLF